MKGFIIAIFILMNTSCSVALQDTVLHNIVSEWAEKNIRISSDFSMQYDGDNIIIVFKEVSKVGSPLIEKISADNLIYRISNSEFDLRDIGSISIIFDLPKSIAVYGKNNEKVNTVYSYNETQRAGLFDFFVIKNASEVSDYITFNMKNSDEIELLQTGNLTNDIYASWYPFKNKRGLEVIYEFSFLDKEEDSDKNIVYSISLSALYKIGQEASIKSLYHLDSIYNILGGVRTDLKLHEIDSMGVLLR